MGPRHTAMKRLALAAVLLITSACHLTTTASAGGAPSRMRRVRLPDVPSFTPPSAPAPAPTQENGLASLAVPGFGPALVAVPRNATRPMPVMIVAHGRNMIPEWQCEDHDKHVVQGRGILLCIRGSLLATSKPGSPAYTHGKELGAEVDAAVGALRARYGALVDPGPMLFAGYSSGAYAGTDYVAKNPARFPRALMIEGGQGGWNEKVYAAGGGQRVLFACGQAACDATARATSARFTRAGVPSRVAYVPGGGHSYGGAVGDAIKANFDWLVEGDPRWRR